jgi:alpha-galactosidase
MSNSRRKITFIGAGSTVFAKNLMGDILSFPELADSSICLFDIDENRLKTSEVVAKRIAQTLGASTPVEVTTDRDRAFDGASYAINMVQVGGYRPCTVTDFEIPKRYGLRQTIADTLGIGGIMRALRTIPVLIDMCRDMERLCPQVVHLNYVNPMAMNCWALSEVTKIRTIGLCHSVQHTAQELAHDIRVPIEEINYVVAGINHMAFYLKFERNGQDLYPEIRRVVAEGRVPSDNRVRYDIFTRLGYFVTESSEHFSEYVPWYIKRGREDLITKFNIPLDEYPRRCESQIAAWEKLRVALEDGDRPFEIKRSVEYGSRIIHSLETGTPRVVYGNVANEHLVENLPFGCCVEVPCVVDKSGVQPVRIGRIPSHLAALMQTNINVQSLTVEAVLRGDPERIYHAAMLDPHTAAELDLDQIWALVNDLLAEHDGWIPEKLRSGSKKGYPAAA